MGKGWCDIDPLTNSFFLLGFLTSVPILLKIDKKCDLESAHRRIHQTDRQTDRRKPII